MKNDPREEIERILSVAIDVRAPYAKQMVDALLDVKINAALASQPEAGAGEFNVNHHVYVRLTDHGRRIHRENHDNIYALLHLDGEYTPPKEDADGWSEWQLWRLMQAFGRHIGNGMTVPFETTIRFAAPAPSGKPEAGGTVETSLIDLLDEAITTNDDNFRKWLIARGIAPAPSGMGKAVACLKAYARWEADIILCDEAFDATDGSVRIPQELWDRMIDVQRLRNEALAETGDEGAARMLGRSALKAEEAG